MSEWFHIGKLFKDIEKYISKKNNKTAKLYELREGLESLYKINEWIKYF